MKAECDQCNRKLDFDLNGWAWVRYIIGGGRDRLVCPECREEAESRGLAVFVADGYDRSTAAHTGSRLSDQARSMRAAKGMVNDE